MGFWADARHGELEEPVCLGCRAELVTGDLLDRDSVIAAAKGVRAVFSVQIPAFTGDGFDYEGEVAQGINLIDGAKAAEVEQFAHMSVTGAGMPAMGASHERLNVTGMPARPEYARELGIALTTFDAWAQQHMHPNA